MREFYDLYPRRSCPICQADEKIFLYRQQFARMSEDGFLQGYDVVVCSSCGFAYADHLPDQAVFDTYYRKLSKYEYHDTNGQESIHDLKRFRSIYKIVSAYLNRLDARVLDIGCATGRLLALFKEAGYHNVIGIDPSAHAAQTANNLFNIKVLNATLADLVQQQEYFDCIVLSGVLEHIRDLSHHLSLISSVLSENGLVFIEVPDVERFPGRPDAPFQEFSTEHINYFTDVSLTNLMRINGFAPVYSEKNIREQSASTSMPVISSIFCKSANIEDRTIVHDICSVKALGDYIRESSLVEDRIHATIERLVKEKISVIVWGVGTHTMHLMKSSQLREVNIKAFVDSNVNYQQRFLEGIPIISPDEIGVKNEPILVSTRVFQAEIVRAIRNDLKLNNEIITLYDFS